MKRLTHLIGYLFTATWLVGLFFKMMHLPGATMLLYASGIGFVCIFIPLLIVYRYNQITKQTFSVRMKWIMGVVTVSLFFVASWMQLYHLEGEALVLAISFLFLVVGFLPFFFFRLYKKSLNP